MTVLYKHYFFDMCWSLSISEPQTQWKLRRGTSDLQYVRCLSYDTASFNRHIEDPRSPRLRLLTTSPSSHHQQLSQWLLSPHGLVAYFVLVPDNGFQPCALPSPQPSDEPRPTLSKELGANMSAHHNSTVPFGMKIRHRRLKSQASPNT